MFGESIRIFLENLGLAMSPQLASPGRLPGASLGILLRGKGFPRTGPDPGGATRGLNPYMILFGINTFSQVFFLCWLLAAFLAREKEKGIAIGRSSPEPLAGSHTSRELPESRF